MMAQDLPFLQDPLIAHEGCKGPWNWVHWKMHNGRSSLVGLIFYSIRKAIKLYWGATLIKIGINTAL